MNGWAWVLIIWLSIETLGAIGKVGRPKREQTWTGTNAILMVGLTVLAVLAVTQ